MGAIHVSGSIALFLFGGILLFIGLFAISTCGTTSGFHCAEPWKGYAWLVGGIGMIFGGVVLAMKSSKPAQEKLEEKPKPAQESEELKESESNFCDNCGKSLRPTAKFCGSCGTSVP